MKKTFTLATCQTYPDLPANLQPLLQQLSHYFEVNAKPWQQITHSDIILPLCAWDYSQFVPHFSVWLQQMATQGSHFVNDISLMQWNMHKSYLCDLQQQEIDVIPTLILAPDLAQIQQIITHKQWQQAVIKPAIGQSGKLVQKIEANQVVDLSAYQTEIVLQPYIAEVATKGETSLIFFKGKFSHAIRRQPAKNEWRANSVYGVQIFPQQVEQKIIQQAQKVFSILPEIPCYARIDGTIINERFLLNEVELIEPTLYLDKVPQGMQVFAEILQNIG